MPIKVYHAPEICPANHEVTIRAFVKDNYQNYHLVATVDTDIPIDALRLTKTVQIRWWLNKGVKFHGSKEWGMKSSRSTYVGDVLILEHNIILAVGPNDTFISIVI